MSTPIPTEPGVYPGLTMDDYLGIQAVNSSTLKHLLTCPLHAAHPPKVDSASMRVGSAVHAALLEPADFDRRYVITPELVLTKNADKEKLAAIQADNPGKELLRPVDLRDARVIGPKGDGADFWAMIETVRGRNPLRALLADGGLTTTELTLLWRDPDTGLLCKARVDGTRGNLLVDVKTAADASPEGFERDAWKLGYYIQASWYLWGWRTAHVQADLPVPVQAEWIWVVLEKAYPWATAVYFPGQSYITHGSRTWRRLLNEYAECVNTGIWPSYNNEKPAELGAPRWAHIEE